MALNDSFMLPKRVRTMAQMADLLQAEQLMLDRLYVIIRELLAQGSINNNTTLTKAELERICELLTGCECRVDEYSPELTIHICIKRNSQKPLSIRALIDGIKVLIPAHLKYVIVPELQAGVNIKLNRTRRRIRYDFCGERFCGELPNRVYQGKEKPENVQIGLKAAGRIFSAAMPKGLGGVCEAAEIEIAARRLAAVFGPKMAKGTSGGSQSGMVLPQVAAEAHVFAAGYCGEGLAGEE